MQYLCVCGGGGEGGGGEGGVNKVQYGLCETGELACKQALLFEHQRSESRKNARASGEDAIEGLLSRVYFSQESI